MNYAPPSICSVCGSELAVTKLTCPNCKTEITGNFKPCRYCALNDKMKRFLETFLKCRGNIKEVERCLSVSYPTAKSLLDELLNTLYPEDKKGEDGGMPSMTVIDLLEKGEISADEAAEMLSGNQG